MIVAAIFLIFNILAVLSQITRKKKLQEELAKTNEPEEITAIQKGIDKASMNVVISIVMCVILVVLFLYLMSAPS